MSGPRKFGLIVFGAILVVLFAGIAIAQGITKPGVDSGDVITVHDVPGDRGNITEEDFERSFNQTWRGGGLQEAPAEGDAQYEQVREASINDLLDQAWLAGEAAELGVTATDREIQNELDAVRQDQFPSEEEFNEFLRETGYTMEEVRNRVELQVLSRKIEQQITSAVTDVPESEVEDFYETSKASFTTPETREIRIIVTDNEAAADRAAEQLGDDPSEQDFARVARRISTHASKDEGGKTVATEGAFPDPAGTEIMSAEVGTTAGPVKAGEQFYIFQVNKVTPEEVRTLDDVRDQIRQQLLPAKQQEAMTRFVANYNSKWRSRTFCDEDYTTARCDNYEGDGRLEIADPRCYEAGAGKNPDLACPAPIALPRPMPPGGGPAPVGMFGETQNPPQRPVQPSDANAEAGGAEGEIDLSQLGAAAGQ